METNSSFRTLFIMKEVPYPPIGGVSLRNWQNINIMMKYGSVAVFSASNWSPKQTTLPGVEIWKHANVEKQLSGWEKLERRFWWLHPRRHPDADWGYTNAAARELDKLIIKFQPDVVIFEEVWVYPYLKVVKRHGCRIIFDNLNVESSLFEQKFSSAKTFRMKLRGKIQLPKVKSIESDFIQQADCIWLCSHSDESLLQELYGQVSPTHIVPNGINVTHYNGVRSDEYLPPKGLEDKDKNLLFLGQLSYAPNTVAAELLIEKIYPKLRKAYPNARLLLVGRNPTEFMLEAAKKDPGIIVTGSVPDVRPYLAAASVMVVPLIQGSGTRLKIVEAFAAGCPVVSTAKGAEGLNGKDGEHLLIRNSVEELVDGVCQIWSDPALGDKLAGCAYELVQREYSWEAVGGRVEEAVKKLLPITL